MNETTPTAPATRTLPVTTITPRGETVIVVEHWVQPSDTFQGICLQYGITSTQLRQANYGFSGTHLSLAPNPLKILNPLKMPSGTLITSTMKIRSTSDVGTDNDNDNQKPPLSLKENPPYLKSSAILDFLRRSAELRQQHPPLAETEARCYLELNEWDVSMALEEYRKDLQRKEEEAGDPNGEVARFDTPVEFVIMDDECM